MGQQNNNHTVRNAAHQHHRTLVFPVFSALCVTLLSSAAHALAMGNSSFITPTFLIIMVAIAGIIGMSAHFVTSTAGLTFLLAAGQALGHIGASVSMPSHHHHHGSPSAAQLAMMHGGAFRQGTLLGDLHETGHGLLQSLHATASTHMLLFHLLSTLLCVIAVTLAIAGVHAFAYTISALIAGITPHTPHRRVGTPSLLTVPANPCARLLLPIRGPPATI